MLALPLLLACGRGIFLNLYSLRVPLGGGVTVNQEDVLLLVQLGVFVYVLGIRPAAARPRMTIQLYLCLGILILLTGRGLSAPTSRAGATWPHRETWSLWPRPLPWRVSTSMCPSAS